MSRTIRIREFENLIAQKIPENAISYIVSLISEHPFNFRLTSDRKTKSGDYRFHRNTVEGSISINKGLNQYAFLITLVHEIAHHFAQVKYGKHRAPHGKEWKNEFKSLMLPLLNNLVFPDAVLQPLAKHLKNPKASTWSDVKLSKALNEYDKLGANENFYLGDLEPQVPFVFNDKTFIKIKNRRTRALCVEAKTKRRYLIPTIARVKVA